MEKNGKQTEASNTDRTAIKCLAECPRCRGEGAEGLCGLDAGHTSGHRCNRCSKVWE